MGRTLYIWPVAVALFLAAASPPAAAQEHGPNLAIRPVPQPGDWWTERFQQINQQVKEHGDAELVFIGDSITSLWRSNGRQTWVRYYQQREALNLGAAGDQIQHTLWRLMNGNLDGLSPRLAVLMVGVNNLYQPQEHVVAGLRKTINYLRGRLPRTRILVLGILPYGERPGHQRSRVRHVNRAVSRMAGPWIHFLDVGRQFVSPDGTISRKLMPDFLHPTALGYELLAGVMEPKIIELLDEDIGRLRYWRLFGLHRGYRDAGDQAAAVDMEAILARTFSHCRFPASFCLDDGPCPAPAPRFTY